MSLVERVAVLQQSLGVLQAKHQALLLREHQRGQSAGAEGQVVTGEVMEEGFGGTAVGKESAEEGRQESERADRGGRQREGGAWVQQEADRSVNEEAHLNALLLRMQEGEMEPQRCDVPVAISKTFLFRGDDGGVSKISTITDRSSTDEFAAFDRPAYKFGQNTCIQTNVLERNDDAVDNVPPLNRKAKNSQPSEEVMPENIDTEQGTNALVAFREKFALPVTLPSTVPVPVVSAIVPVVPK